MDSKILIEINQAVSQYGGTSGVRDINLIESAIGRGDMAEMYGQDRIGAVFESLIKNHPFIDGNKRTAVVYLIFSIFEKGFSYNCEHIYLSKIVDNLAADKITINEAMKSIYENSNIVDESVTIDEVLEMDLVKKTLDILARKDSDDLTNDEKEWFNR